MWPPLQTQLPLICHSLTNLSPFPYPLPKLRLTRNNQAIRGRPSRSWRYQLLHTTTRNTHRRARHLRAPKVIGVVTVLLRQIHLADHRVNPRVNLLVAQLVELQACPSANLETKLILRTKTRMQRKPLLRLRSFQRRNLHQCTLIRAATGSTSRTSLRQHQKYPVGARSAQLVHAHLAGRTQMLVVMVERREARPGARLVIVRRACPRSTVSAKRRPSVGVRPVWLSLHTSGTAAKRNSTPSR